MESVMLRAACRLIVPGQWILAFILLLRGHNEPGGGFIGGLVAACAVVLYGIANGQPAAREMLRFSPEAWIAAGLALASGSTLFGPVTGGEFMKGMWGGSVPSFVAGDVKLGSPFLFDVGVFCVVLGVGVRLVFSLQDSGGEEDTRWS